MNPETKIYNPLIPVELLQKMKDEGYPIMHFTDLDMETVMLEPKLGELIDKLGPIRQFKKEMKLKDGYGRDATFLELFLGRPSEEKELTGSLMLNAVSDTHTGCEHCPHEGEVNVKWIASYDINIPYQYICDDEPYSEEGVSPEEAVAKLWLALNPAK